MPTNLELRSVILAALECKSHFHKPHIIEKDKDFKLGPRAQVICSSCVDRMQKALGLPDCDGDWPCHSQYFNAQEQHKFDVRDAREYVKEKGGKLIWRHTKGMRTGFSDVEYIIKFGRGKDAITGYTDDLDKVHKMAYDIALKLEKENYER
jgi:hypothetical protein